MPIGQLKLTKLDNKACVEKYATPFVTQYGNVILTANRSNPNTTIYDNNSLLMVSEGNYESYGDGSLGNSYNWMCAKGEFDTGYGSLPSCSSILANSSAFEMKLFLPLEYNASIQSYAWDYRTVPIGGCFSQRLDEKCTVETTMLLLGIVIAFIICKVLCMFWIFWTLDESPLAVVGDAVASFMQNPDESTKGACLGTASTFSHNTSWQRTLKWSPQPIRWSQNVSGSQWTACILLFVPFPPTVCSLLTICPVAPLRYVSLPIFSAKPFPTLLPITSLWPLLSQDPASTLSIRALCCFQ